METYSKQLQSVVSPKFTEEVLLGILERIFKVNDVKITNISFKFDSSKGDSFLSTVSQFTVEAKGVESDGQEKSIMQPIICKALPANIARRKTFRSLDFFKNEVIFYNTTWPAMNEFQLSKNSTPVFNDIPLCISALCDGINDYVTLEDLSIKGYESVARSTGLDLEHTKLVINLFANFHALGLAFKDQKPDEFKKAAESLQETYLAEQYRSWYEPFLTKNLYKVVRDAVEKELPGSYLEKLNEVLSGDLYGSAAACCADKGQFAVITHGDAWIPNFLMKYSSNKKPESAYMIDFQLTRYSSLALDILFFLYTCTDQHLRLQHWDHIIEYYHETFVATLAKLGSSPSLLTLADLRSEFKKYIKFGLLMSMEAVTMSMAEDDAFDLDSIKEGQERTLETVWVIHPFEEAEKRQRLAYTFKHIVDSGFLE